MSTSSHSNQVPCGERAVRLCGNRVGVFACVEYCVEDGRFDYVGTGSLLGVRTREVPSYPVGFEEHHRMFPMAFEEFCLTNAVQACAPIT